MNIPSMFLKRFDFNLGNFTISPSYIQAGAIVLLLFILLLLFSNLRRHLLNWSFKGSVFGIFWGFLLALVIEGFLIIGGKTAITEVLGWENAPKPLLNVIDMGRNKLTEVLGVEKEIPTSYAEEVPTYQTVMDDFRKLNAEEVESIKSLICNP